MEPDVIRLYSSSPPPLDEPGEEEEEDEFGEFGSFSSGGVASSFSFSEIDTPRTFNQSNALEDSPPALYITSVQDATISGKSVWAKEKKTVRESQPCVISNQDTPRNETEVHSCVENTEKKPSEIVMNCVASPDLQKELFIEHGVSSSDQHCPQVLPDVRHSTGQHIDSTGDGHSLSNGYSESCMCTEQETESSVSSGLDVKVADVRSNEEQNLPVSNSQSFHKEVSESEETETKVELCHDFQSFSPCKDSQEAGGEKNQKEHKGTEEMGIPDTPSSSSDENVVCNDTHFLDWPTDCVDIAETATAPPTVVDINSETQLSGDIREIHESSVKAEMEVDVDNKAFNETSDEDFGDFRDAQGFMDISQTESITQDGFADFVTAMSRCSTDDEFGDTDTLKDFQEEGELAVKEEKSVDCAGDEGDFCSELPPSDSFADFSSAPFGGVAVEEENWASFGQHEAAEEGQDSWAAFEDEQSTFPYKKIQDVETSATPCSDNLQSNRTDRETAEFSCKIQHLFKTAFPSDVNLEVTGVTQVLSLQDVLQAQDPQDQEDLSSFSQRHELAMWRHLQDIHGAHGLKFKWAGSQSNRVLLDCLGIRNILFTGEKKQPLIVPMFAAGLGMLEPTKESQKSPASPSVPVESGNILCTQVAPSLTISFDGVDPELYELTTAKMETKTAGHSIADAFTKLMESMEKTRTTARKPERDEKISEEAARVISLLPDLSFMKARVLMFPSILNPASNHT